MNNHEVQIHLREKHSYLINWLSEHDDQKWEKGPIGKWTTGQHALHLIQSLRPLNKALSFPKFLIKYKFGISNRATRNYHEVVERYQEKLAGIGDVVSPFSKNMSSVSLSEKAEIIKSLEFQYEKLIKKISRWKEDDLDKYILPHPLMGKMPIREISMWSGYHAEHHHKILQEKY